jgi:hypothetical protein
MGKINKDNQKVDKNLNTTVTGLSELTKALQKVEKMAFSPEEQAVVNNLIALINELQSMAMGEEVSQAPDMPIEEKQMEQTDRPVEDEEEISKGLEQTASDGSTANDDAGVRDEGNATDIMEDGVAEAKKALLKLLTQKTETQKSAVKESKITMVLSELVKTVKSINDRLEITETAMENTLKGLGIAKAIEEETEKVEKAKPIRSNKETEELVNYIKEALGVEKSVDKQEGNIYLPGNQNAEARKSIGGWLPKVVTKR